MLRRAGQTQPRPPVAVEDKQAMSDLSSLISLLVRLEEERKKATSSEREGDLFDRDTCSSCMKQINSAATRLLASHVIDYKRSSELFQAMLIKRTLLLCFELLCYSKSTRLREMKELSTSVQAFNSHVNTRWKREGVEESTAQKKDNPAVAISFADMADILVLCRSGVISWRVEREGVAAVQHWWGWAEEERMRVREMISVLAAQTSLLAAGGRNVSVEAVMRVTEGRLWKEVGRRVRSGQVHEALRELIDSDGKWVS